MNSLYLFPALLATSTATLLANGGGYLEGIKSTGPFRPVNVDSVEMVSEKLDVELKQHAAVISIAYRLHNPGDAVTVEMGFPCAVTVKSEYDEEGRNLLPLKGPLPQLEGFMLSADGKALKSHLTKDHATLPRPDEEDAQDNARIITGWQLVTLPFAAGQTREVSVRYLNPYYRWASYISDNSDKSAPSMSYLFSAAALWKGSIRTGEVTVRATGVNPDDVTLSHPRRFKRSGSQWTWSFNDFEPTMEDDLQIVVGEHEFKQSRDGENGNYVGTYVMRGKSSNHKELQKSGKWFFVSRPYSAAASSSLKPNGGLNYGPENLNNDVHDDAWVEGSEGDGIGESLTLTMSTPQKATRLIVHNGYRKDAGVFRKNNRVKRLGVSVNGGRTFSVDLPDGMDHECPIDLPKDAGQLRTVKLTIEGVHRGTSFHDTCISAVDVEVPLSKAPPIFPCR